MAATEEKGAAILARFERDILRLFDAAPAYGSVSFSIIMVAGEPHRFEYAASVGQLVKPDRGQR